MTDISDHLKKVYGARSVAEIRDAYQGWANAYDADNLVKGFRLPGLAAGLAARHVPVDTGPILDAGCGTGLVGESLSIFGYRELIGLDLSQEMLAAAESRGVYRRLFTQELGKPIDLESDSVAAFTCIGSFGPGHAPPSSLDELVRVVRPGGVGIFNLVDRYYEELGFAAKMQELTEAGLWREKEVTRPFPFYLLAEPDLTGRIYVFEVL